MKKNRGINQSNTKLIVDSVNSHATAEKNSVKKKKSSYKQRKSKYITKRRILLVVIVSAVVILSLMYYEFTRSKDIKLIISVSSPEDDARTFTTDNNELGFGNEDGGWAMLQLAPSYSFGVRFVNVTLPDNAKIKDAYVELYSVGTPGIDHPNCRIYCDASANAVNFSVKGVLDRCGRNYTTNFTIWNETVPYGKWIRTPSITAQIREVINRENWTSGNAIAVLFVSEGLRGYSATFQNFENGYPARLHIIYEKEEC